jgi:parallel beta-helix repeat protein
MRIVIPNIAAALAIAASLAWPTTAAALGDLILNVNCASGDRIASALGRLNVLDRRMVIIVTGTCTENVTIERDDVVLRGQGSGAGVSAADPSKPAILINGARRVAVEGLTVAGGLHGVQATGGASITIRASAISGAATHGVLIDRGANAVVDGSTIESNGQTGVQVLQVSNVTMTASTMQGNGLYGVAVGRNSSAILGADNGGTVCCGNTIQNNGFDGLLVADSSSALLYGNVIQGNGSTPGRFGVLAIQESSVVLRGGNVVRGNGSATAGGGVFSRSSSVRFGLGDTPLSPTTNEISGNTFGIQVFASSNLDLRGGVIVTGSKFNGVTVDQGSRFQTNGSTISTNGGYGIFVQRASSVDLIGALTVVTGNINLGLLCADEESSLSGNTNGISGNGGGGPPGTGGWICSGYSPNPLPPGFPPAQ